MPELQTRTLTLTLRWDGPRLTREQLAAKANDAIARADRHLRHLAMDIQAMPSEEQQYVQLSIRTECADADVDRLKRTLREAFGRSGQAPARPSAPLVANPATVIPRGRSVPLGAFAGLPNAAARPLDGTASASWPAWLGFVLVAVLAAAVAFVAFASPFLPDDLRALLP